MKQGRRGTPALPHRPAFPPSAPPEYVEGGTPKEKRPFLFQNAFPPAKNKMQGAFFLSGLPPYSAACGGGSAQSERTVQVQAITRSARAKWVRAWVRISSQKETSSEVSSERKPARSGFACILPRSTAAYSDGGGIRKCMDLHLFRIRHSRFFGMLEIRLCRNRNIFSTLANQPNLTTSK